MKLKLALALVFTALLCQSAYSQAWSGILDPSRAIDWTQAGVVGGIPNRTTICATVAPSGLSDATDMNNIDAALQSCPPNEVVLLEAGTYTLTGGITFGDPAVNNVTLRGAGPNQTILKFTGTVGCAERADICIEGNDYGADGYFWGSGASTTWTAGYAQGTSTITVGSTTGLSVGQVIVLDQRNDSIGEVASPNGETESGNTVTVTTSIPHGFKTGQTVLVGPEANGPRTAYDGTFTITAVPSSTQFQYTDPTGGLQPSGGDYVAVDTGGVFTCDIDGACILSNNTYIGRVCPDSNDPSCASGEVSRRSQIEIKTITAINGNQITISPSLQMTNWRASQSPGVWWTGAHASGDGVENLTLNSLADGGSGNTGSITFFNATNSWEKNVRSLYGDSDHVDMRLSSHISVVDSYFMGTKHSASNSYGTDFDGSSDCLVQNNIFEHVAPGVQTEQDYGSVAAYNYFTDNGYDSPGWMLSESSANHGVSGYVLFEGNDTNMLTTDNIHGSSSMATMFRNRGRGQDSPLRSQSLVAAAISGYERGENFIGNILGTAGTETEYQDTSTVNVSGAVFSVGTSSGFIENGGGRQAIASDPIAVSSLLRWGNYDVVTGATRWCGNSSDTGWSTVCGSQSEIPTAGMTFVNGNPAPTVGDTGAGQPDLPASFYLSAQPPFWETAWGTPPWPAIGPDVQNGNAPDGNDPGAADNHSNAIPAQLCYENTPFDPAYQQSFTITGASWSSGTATLTLNNSGANALVADDTIKVSGISSSGGAASFNGTFSVVSASASSITYALPSDPGSYNSGGAVTYPNILLFNAANCYTAEYSATPASPTALAATVH